MHPESLRKAMRTITTRRENAELAAEQRKEEIKKKTPEFCELLGRISGTGGQIARAMLSNQKDIRETIERIMRDNLDAQDRIKVLLQQNGYPENYLEPCYSCPECNDSGYVEGRQCSCLKQLAVQYEAEDFNAKSKIKPQQFSSFSLEYYPDAPVSGGGRTSRQIMEEIFEFCQAYAHRFEQRSPSILMMGPTGLGKTHLSLSIASEVIERGYTATYASAPDLFRQLQDEYYGKGAPGKDTMDMLLKTDLVVLDDIGSELENQFNISAFYNVVNSRLNLEKPVIINTNLTSKELEARYTSRISSRLTLYKCLKFSGIDIRQQKLRNNIL